MGCDIHIGVEKRTSRGWVAVKKVNTWYEPNDEYSKPHTCVVIDGHRNYELFGALSGVRDTSIERFEFSYEGFPDDVSNESSDYFDYENYGDLHSHTHLYLDDLFEAAEEEDKAEKRTYDKSWQDQSYNILLEFAAYIKKQVDELLPGVDPGDLRLMICYDN